MNMYVSVSIAMALIQNKTTLPSQSLRCSQMHAWAGMARGTFVFLVLSVDSVRLDFLANPSVLFYKTLQTTTEIELFEALSGMSTTSYKNEQRE